MEKLVLVLLFAAIGFIAVLSPIMTLVSLVRGVTIPFGLFLVTIVELVLLIIWISYQLTGGKKSEKKNAKEIRNTVKLIAIVLGVCALSVAWSASQEGQKANRDSTNEYRSYNSSHVSYPANSSTGSGYSSSTGGGKSYRSSSSPSTTRRPSSTYSSSFSGSKRKNSGSSGSAKYRTQDSYDDGYEAVYDDDDYDVDRYSEDDDYASGVDDAMEDLADEGEFDW